MENLIIKTEKDKQVVDITNILTDFLKKNGKKNGICFVSALHTTVALSVADLDPGTDLDMLDAFYEMVPSNKKMGYRHPHDPDHLPDHVLSAMIGPSLVLSVKEGELILGTWQRAVLFEFDGPQERKLAVNVVS